MNGLHPEMQAILLEQRDNPLPAPETLPIAQARAQFVDAQRPWNAELPAMRAHDLVVGGIDCRLLHPGAASNGLIVFVHGGGWTFGSPATHEGLARLLAEATQAQVLVPDYRLAPEHRAPAAIDDIAAVVADLGGFDDQTLILCGDSAGANIALATALTRPVRPIALVSLLYGCFAPMFDTESHRRNGAGDAGMTTAQMRWYWQNWLGPDEDPRAAPLTGDLAGLPPCHLLAAGLDPVLDDSLELAGCLAHDGVSVRLDVIPGVTHGFLQMTSRLSPAREAIGMVAGQIKAAIGR